MGTEGASENLVSYLDKIKEIEKESQFNPDSYDSFKRKTYLDQDLNLYTENLIKREREQLKLKRE